MYNAIHAGTKFEANKSTRFVSRGDICFADLNPAYGSEQGGIRPVMVLQNNVGNKYSPTVIVAAITSQQAKNKLPTHVEVESSCGLVKKSVVLLEQVRTLDKRRLKEKIGNVDSITMSKINRALAVSVGLIFHC